MTPRARLISAAVLLLALVAAAPAQATEVTTVSMNASGWTVRSVETQGDRFAGGQQSIRASVDPTGGLRIEDNGPDTQNFVAEAPCSLLEARVALCPAHAGNTGTLDVSTGGDDDSITVGIAEVRNAAGVLTTRLSGGTGSDIISGSVLAETIEGDGRAGNGSSIAPPFAGGVEPGGSDRLAGNGGADTVRGGAGNDYLNGGFIGQTVAEGGNILDGGADNDFLDAGATLGPDRLTGGSQTRSGVAAFTIEAPVGLLPNGVVADVRGGDTVSYGTRTYTTGGTVGVTADLDGVADDGTTGASENDQIDADVESLGGTIRNDTLSGSSSFNFMVGGLGVDTLTGGSGGADVFNIRDGVADACIPVGADDVIDADLQDPNPAACSPTPPPPPAQATTPTQVRAVLILISFTFNFKPVDETIPYIGIGTLKRKGSDTLTARVSCAEEAKKACTGVVRVAKFTGGKAVGTKKFRLPPGRAAAVALKLPAARVAALRKDGGARVLTVSKGTSKKGPTTTLVHRRLK